MPLPHLPQLVWHDGDFPSDGQSGDVFYAREGGLAETRAVFLDGCGLPQAWQDKPHFAIGELGFGSGLNALACWQLWHQTRPKGATLSFVSIESHPWQREDAARAHGAFPEIGEFSARLLARWPHRAFGPQRLWFPDDGFCLTLWIGPCEDVLRGLSGCFDAWLLDGFAPARNPQMWTGAVMRQIARLSAPGARLATYSVAGGVREALREAGFAVTKQPGFGNKRQRLEAALVHAPACSAHGLFPRTRRTGASGPAGRDNTLVIGAGIAGAAMTKALARRGVPVIVLDAGSGPASGASGNPLALLTPRLDRSDDAGARFFRAAYLCALDAYAGQPWFQACGALQRPRQSEDQLAITQMLTAPPFAPELLSAHPGGAWHGQAGVVRPAALLEDWLASAHVRYACQPTSLDHEDGHWHARDGQGNLLARARHAVICAGPALAGFAQTSWLPLAFSAGQIEYAQDGGPLRLDHAITGAGYGAPWGASLVFGATFDPQADAQLALPSAASRQRNLATLAALTGRSPHEIERLSLTSRTGIRASAPDRLPIAGLMPDASTWLRQYAGLAHGRPADLSQPAPAYPGLYVLGGLSARGFLTAPILGEQIAAEICGTPAMLDCAMLHALHPTRFLLRALKRGQMVPPA